MPSIAKVAWGLILVYVDLRIDELDLVPDLLGWGLVVLGLVPLLDRSGWFRVAAAAALLGLVGSLSHVVSTPVPAAILVEQVANTVLAIGICTAVIRLVPVARMQRRAGLVRAWMIGLGIVGVGVLVAQQEGTVPGPLAQQPDVAVGVLGVLLVAAVVAAMVLMVVWVVFLFGVARADLTPTAATLAETPPGTPRGTA